MFGHFSSWVFIVVHTQRLLSVFWIPSTESTWTYLHFGVAEELSDFSCIACGIYIYNEMLQPDCNNLPNALPGTLHCRWICPGKEGNTCEPPVIDSWKSKSMSSTSCTWFANVKFAVMSMAYDGLPCAWNRVQVLGSANPSDIIPQSSILIMRTIIHSPEVWLRRFDRKNGWPSHANDKEL